MNYQLHFLVIGLLGPILIAAKDDDVKIVKTNEIADTNEITNADELASTNKIINADETANANDSDKGWKKFHYQVYSHKGAPIGTLETHELLKSLEEFYSGRNDAGSIGRRKRVKALIEACKITDDKCVENSFKQLDALIEYNAPFKINVLPYLESCRKRQFQHCKPILINELKKIVDQSFSKEEKADMLALRHYGVLRYMRTRSNSLRTKDVKNETDGKSLQDFTAHREDIQKLVGKLCFNVVKIVNPIWKIYDQLKDSDILSKMDKLTLKWIKNTEVCHFIIDNIDSISEETYEKLRNHKKSWKDRILGCFTGNH